MLGLYFVSADIVARLGGDEIRDLHALIYMIRNLFLEKARKMLDIAENYSYPGREPARSIKPEYGNCD